MCGDAAGFIHIAAVERGLAAAGLVLAEIDLASGALQNFGHGDSDARENLIDDAGDKNRDARQGLVYFDVSFQKFHRLAGDLDAVAAVFTKKLAAAFGDLTRVKLGSA